MDLGDSVGRALRVAKRGDYEGLERELRRLQSVGVENVATVSLRLRNLAKSVRSHPSFAHSATARAG